MKAELGDCFLRYLLTGLVVTAAVGMETTRTTTTTDLRMVFGVVAENNNNSKTARNCMSINVGVILDLNGWVGKMVLSCINMSFSDFYASHSHYNTTIVLHVRDSKADAVQSATQVMELIQKSKVEAIIGPERWSEAYFIMKLGEKVKIPIISFAPTMSTLNPPYFFRISQTHSSQVSAITDIIKTFNWTHVVVLYEDDEFGNWIIADLTNALQDDYVRVQRTVIHPIASNDHIKEKLYNLSFLQARVFVLHMTHNLVSRVFAMADQIGMMNEGYAWILTDTTSNVLNTLNSSILSSMQGVLGLKTHVPKTLELQKFIHRWRKKFDQQPEGMDVIGLWAYDATWALAMAVEKIMDRDHYSNFTYEVLSQKGKKISEALTKMKFKGVSGEFNMINNDRQSPSSNLEVVNVIGNREITVGYWTPEMGLTGKFNRKSCKLRPIIWPGYSVTAPKGWGSRRPLRSGERELKIGVVMNSKLREFAEVVNGSMVGYCIDIFDAVVKELPYELPRNYSPFVDAYGHGSATIDDLIHRVFEHEYDVAIGDITILANRSLYVDFSLPFSEAGIGVVIPLKHNLRNHTWVFLQPFTLNLWFTSFCFFIFMSFILWILEHRNHENFHGRSPLHQITTSLWLSFCTIVFAHWDSLMSNLARFVVVIWFFVMFILTQSYTASLTSWLTVQQLQPRTDINQIIKEGWRVGYQDGSYVLHTLQVLGIKDLVAYTSFDHLQELFTKGCYNGGIDAVIDEIPYMKLFLSRFHDDYIMADSLFKSNGFGFAFPLGSSIVEDMSKAMLKVTESGKISEIQDTWFQKKRRYNQSNCYSKDNDTSSSSSSRLDLSYFWILFLIAASAAIFALLLYFFLFLHKGRSSLHRIHSDTILWKTILTTFHTFNLRHSRRPEGEPPAAPPTPPAHPLIQQV